MNNKNRKILLAATLVLGGIFAFSKMNGAEIPHFLRSWWVYPILLFTLLRILEQGTDTKTTLVAGGCVLYLIFFNGTLFTGSFISGAAVLALGIYLLRKRGGDDNPFYTAIFSSSSFHEESEALDGTRLFALFGELRYDASRKNPGDDTIIDVTTVFSSAKLTLPEGYRVVVQGTPLLGSIKEREEKELPPEAPVITVRALALFGEVVIH